MDEKLLLEILQKDARISVSNLAKMLKSSEKDVEKKIEELKRKGVIKGFRTYVDWEARGDEYVTAHIGVKVTPEAKTGFSELGRQLAANERIEEVCVTSGDYDLTVKMKAKNIKDVGNFVTEVLAPKKEVMATATHFVLKKFKENGVVLSADASDKKPIISA
jgi:DNA-binding Lrp family transcriptional regulator